VPTPKAAAALDWAWRVGLHKWLIGKSSSRRSTMPPFIRLSPTSSKPWQIRLLLARVLEGRELARCDRYLSRDLKFADAVG